jgi:uncharacterized RDD family membrane protein YckC
MNTGTPPPLNPIPPLIADDCPIPSGAKFGIRGLARFIDIVYGLFLGLIVGFGTGILFAILSHLGMLSPDWPQRITQHSLRGFGMGIVGAFLYQSIAEGMGTVSIGKLICGLRVVQSDGRPVTMKGAFIRDLAYHLDALFFGLIAYIRMQDSRLQQRYGDAWGKTVVVQTSIFQPHPSRSGLQMFTGILLGTLAWVATLLLQMIFKVL